MIEKTAVRMSFKTGSLYEAIIEAVREAAQRTGVSDIRIGLGYIAVRLDDGGTGFAATLFKDLQAHCTRFDGRRLLQPDSAFTLVQGLTSENSIEAAVGLAAVNALSNRPITGHIPGDILEAVSILPSDRVGMVGYFPPLVQPIQKKAGELLIFEQVASAGKNLLPASEARARLGDCQVAVITATSLINHTIEELLVAAQNCREVVLLGASTPLLPEVFAETPITLLSGVLVTRPEEALKIVSLGGGTRLLKPCVQKVNLKIK